MRYISRQQAIDALVPKSARMVQVEPHQIAFSYDDTLTILALFQIPNSCEDCCEMWATKLIFKHKVSEL